MNTQVHIYDYNSIKEEESFRYCRPHLGRSSQLLCCVSFHSSIQPRYMYIYQMKQVILDFEESYLASHINLPNYHITFSSSFSSLHPLNCAAICFFFSCLFYFFFCVICCFLEFVANLLSYCDFDGNDQEEEEYHHWFNQISRLINSLSQEMSDY